MNRNKEFAINEEEENDIKEDSKEKTKKSKEILFDQEDKLFLFKAGVIVIFFIIFTSILFGTILKDPFDSPNLDSPKKPSEKKSICGNEICELNEYPINCPRDCKFTAEDTLKDVIDNTKTISISSFLYDDEGKLDAIKLAFFIFSIIILYQLITRRK